MATQGARASPEPGYLILRLQNKGSEATLGSWRYQKRKSHPKSKAGCLSCKSRAVKCDEGKPDCRRCVRNKWQCVYTTAGRRRGGPPADHRQPDPRDSMALSSRAQISCMAPSAMRGESMNSPDPDSLLQLIRHFSISPREVLGTPESTSVLRLGSAQPYLLDAVLAVAASHLRVHTSGSGPPPAKMRVAELSLQNLAIAGFSKALTEPIVDQDGSDALLLAALIMNLMSFSSVEDDDPKRSWVFSDDRRRLDWFSLVLGYFPVRIATAPFHKNSIMSWMFAISASKDDDLSLDHVPRAWRRLCGLDGTPDPKSMFYGPLRMLAKLKHLRAHPGTFFVYLAFFGSFDRRYRGLLERRDERAFWLLGYWFGLLCRFDMWWLQRQSRRDYRAVQIWLDQQDHLRKTEQDRAMWDQLRGDLNAASQQPDPISVEKRESVS